MSSRAETVRKIGLFGCIANGVGAIIGSGIFGALPEGINSIGIAVIPALFLAVIYTIANMFPNVYASSIIPTSGSFFLYSTKLIHPFFGLWMTLQGMLQPALIGTFAVMFAEYFVVLFPQLAGHEIAIGVAILVVFGVLAWLGNHTFASVNNVMVVVMLLAIGVYVFVGVPHIDMSHLSLSDSLASGMTVTSFSATVGLFTSTLSGAGSVSQIADDTKNPTRDIPLTLILAPTIVCVVYMLMALVTLGTMPGAEVANLADVGGQFLGSGILTFFIVGGPICGIMTSMVPVIMLSCALIQSSADNAVFPAFVAKRNKHGVSTVILIFVVGFSIFLVGTGSGFGELMTLFSFVNTACAVPTCLVPFFLRKKYPHACQHAGLRLNIPLVYTLSIFALIVSIYLAITMFIELELLSWIIVGVVVVATAVYFFIRVSYVKAKGGDLIADLRAPYADWEAREAECAAMDNK